MRLRIAPLALAVLAGLVLLDAWLLAIVLEVAPEAVPELPAPAASAPRAAESQAAAAQPFQTKPITAFSQTLARPLLFRDRKPYVPAPPPQPVPAAKPPAPPLPAGPSVVLGGVMITENARKAYIVNKSDSRGTWLSEGETVQGWTVQSIGAKSATLGQTGRIVEIELYPSTK